MDWRIYISLLLALVAVAAALLIATTEPDVAENSAGESTTTTAVDENLQRPTATPQDRGESDVTGRANGSSRGQAAPTESPAAGRESARGTADRENASRSGGRSPSDGPTDEEIPDMGTDEDMRPWRDSVNQRVLGDKRWMAPVSDEERAKIDEIFRKAREARHDPTLSRVETLASKEAAERIVADCYDELAARSPAMRGRIIVRWQSGADERGGWIRDPEILVNYKLEDPEFERCVVSRLDDTVFAAQPAEPRVIEHPFFFDGSF